MTSVGRGIGMKEAQKRETNMKKQRGVLMASILLASGILVSTGWSLGAVHANANLTFSVKTTSNGLGNDEVYGLFAVGSTVYAATEGGLSISTNGASRS